MACFHGCNRCGGHNQNLVCNSVHSTIVSGHTSVFKYLRERYIHAHRVLAGVGRVEIRADAEIVCAVLNRRASKRKDGARQVSNVRVFVRADQSEGVVIVNRVKANAREIARCDHALHLVVEIRLQKFEGERVVQRVKVVLAESGHARVGTDPANGQINREIHGHEAG